LKDKYPSIKLNHHYETVRVRIEKYELYLYRVDYKVQTLGTLLSEV